tara:strand:+ start:1003 stop:1113 length:111 start_codon:yes stop_codon:yes gene_type:complete
MMFKYTIGGKNIEIFTLRFKETIVGSVVFKQLEQGS